MTLYQRYKESKTRPIEDKISVVNDIINQYPKILDYLYNRIDTCFGEHKVYLVHMKVNGEDMMKIGYTKNTVSGRFSEKRYAGRNTIEIIEILRENTLQAKGAVDFEDELKRQSKDYKIKTDLTLPGKDEFMSITYKDILLELYDSLYSNYVNVVGLKSPN